MRLLDVQLLWRAYLLETCVRWGRDVSLRRVCGPHVGLSYAAGNATWGIHTSLGSLRRLGFRAALRPDASRSCARKR